MGRSWMILAREVNEAEQTAHRWIEELSRERDAGNPHRLIEAETHAALHRAITARSEAARALESVDWDEIEATIVELAAAEIEDSQATDMLDDADLVA